MRTCIEPNIGRRGRQRQCPMRLLQLMGLMAHARPPIGPACSTLPLADHESTGPDIAMRLATTTLVSTFALKISSAIRHNITLMANRMRVDNQARNRTFKDAFRPRDSDSNRAQNPSTPDTLAYTTEPNLCAIEATGCGCGYRPCRVCDHRRTHSCKVASKTNEIDPLLATGEHCAQSNFGFNIQLRRAVLPGRATQAATKCSTIWPIPTLRRANLCTSNTKTPEFTPGILPGTFVEHVPFIGRQVRPQCG